MPIAGEFVPTAIGKGMTVMLRDTHHRRGIAIFSGPPGIGKTTALEAFAAEHDGQVVIVKTERTGKQGMGSRMVMQEMVMAMRAQRFEGYAPLSRHVPSETPTRFGDRILGGDDAPQLSGRGNRLSCAPHLRF